MTADITETRADDGASPPAGSRLRGGLALFALGMTGVVAIAMTVAPTLRGTPGLEGLSYPALVAVAAANSTVLLAVFVALGAVTAPRVGLRSHVYAWASGGRPDWSAVRDSLPLAVAVGAATFVVVFVLDAAFAPFVAIDGGMAGSDAETLRALAASAPYRLLYGGITEELLLRWGVMAPLAWALWWVGNRVGERRPSPSAAAVWAAIVVAAVLFGLGHLPALLATYDASVALVVRTVLLNTIAGVALGWLFWRRSLETAMVAHASFHVTLLTVSAVLVVAL
ncbi:type II CAAX prenyl endopeptidase Rce1 family protein [Haloglomus litoreum]|uniref:CPBP family glutamic-type intramembrane protease n=1 Tax=Haloglomus litoreum TaxID=3034026 RepID=UPI0023E80482|nr:CPBP family glutamic-type intramembrane protease [Haloglomus sp. DT116]